MKSLVPDVRYGLRMLLKSPGLTIVAVLSLAIGIGANTSIFSIINGVLFRPLPHVQAPERLVAVYTSDYSGPLYGTSSYPDYLDLRGKTDAVSDLLAYTVRPMSLSADGGEAERILGTIASGNYFSVLGVRAAEGRTFTREEDETPEAAPVVVVSHGLWQRRFGSDPSLVGKTVTLNGHPFTVVGIAPPQFTGTLQGIAPDVWVPINMNAQARGDREMLAGRSDRWLFLMGRLKDGTSLARARESFDAMARGLHESYPEEWSNVRGETRSLTLLPEGEARVPPQVRGALLGVAGLLMVVVLLVLLIACANVANLLLARASVRRKEIGIRLALGASRWRIMRQLLTESVLLGLLGGAAGLLVALWTIDLLMSFSPPTPVPIAVNFSPDLRVLAFTFVLSVLTGLIFGSAPALQATRPDVLSALKDEGASATGGDGRRRFKLRNLLVVAQISVSMVLLVGAGLLIRSMQNAQAINPGFRSDGVLIMTPETEIQGYTKEQGQEFYRQLMTRVEALPGVASASLAESVPLAFEGSRRGISVEGYERRKGEDSEYHYNTVGSRYFETMGIDLAAGRSFADTDREGAPGVVIVNESFARRFWPGQNPLGKRLSASGPQGKFLEIVGVAKDGKYNTLGEAPLPFVYFPFGQNYSPGMTLHVRTSGDPKNLLAAVRDEVRALDKNLPVSNVKTLNEHLGGALLLPRVGAMLLGILGLLALVLAAAGLFGVMSFSVARQTREIGIRMALGAQPRDVLKLVLTEGMSLVVFGVCLGLALSFAATRLLSGFLYGVSATDPVTFALITLLLAGVALLAALLPARRATKVDPMVALRYE